jgi:hypothetical protein
MPANTPNGLPYPLGTDPLAQGDDAIHALATELDKRVPYRLAGGQGVAVGIVANGAFVNVNVVYPVGLFTTAPNVHWNTGSNRLNGALLANTKDGCTIQLANFSGAASVATTLTWTALQLPV